MPGKGHPYDTISWNTEEQTADDARSPAATQSDQKGDAQRGGDEDHQGKRAKHAAMTLAAPPWSCNRRGGPVV